MTDSMREAIDRQLVPSGHRLRLVQHIPFLTSLSSMPADLDLSPSSGQADDTGDLLRINRSEPALELQLYTAVLEGELRRFLPHRVASIDVHHLATALGGREWSRFQLRSAQCHLWDSGSCVLVITYDVDTTRVTCKEVRTAIDQLHEGALAQWRGIARRCAARYASAFDTGSSAANSIGEPQTLWVHDTLIFDEPASGDLAEIADYYTDGGTLHELTMERRRWPLRLGLTACLVTNQSVCRETTIRIMETHQALWSAAIDYDRRLFRALSQDTAGKGLRYLEKELDDLLDVERKVSSFASKVSAVPVHLARLDQQLWTAVHESWRLQDQIDSLTEKLTALRSSYSDVAARIGTQRSRRLSYFLAIFTLLTAVSTAASLRLFVQQDLKSANPTSVQWLLIFIGIAAVLAAVLMTFVMRGYQRQHRRRSATTTMITGRPRQGKGFPS